MELKFLGRGGAFLTEEGNTSAYFFDNRDLLLLDCGENIFGRVMKQNLLTKAENVNVLITHTHPDHIGGLCSLIFYNYYALGKVTNIILPTQAKYKDNISTILKCLGCDEELYSFVDETAIDNKYSSFSSVRFLPTKHAPHLDCYSIIFETPNGIVYYSGDTSNTKQIRSIIDNNEKIDKLFIETTTYDTPNNIHTNIDILNAIVPPKVKPKVYCMHFNSQECIQKALDLGFNVVEVEQTKEPTKEITK